MFPRVLFCSPDQPPAIELIPFKDKLTLHFRKVCYSKRVRYPWKAKQTGTTFSFSPDTLTFLYSRNFVLLESFCFYNILLTPFCFRRPQHGWKVAQRRRVVPGTGPEERRYHNYYMWVPYMLFLQSVSFYLPHWIWKVVQTDKVRGILQVSSTKTA